MSASDADADVFFASAFSPSTASARSSNLFFITCSSARDCDKATLVSCSSCVIAAFSSRSAFTSRRRLLFSSTTSSFSFLASSIILSRCTPTTPPNRSNAIFSAFSISLYLLLISSFSVRMVIKQSFKFISASTREGLSPSTTFGAGRALSTLLLTLAMCSTAKRMERSKRDGTPYPPLPAFVSAAAIFASISASSRARSCSVSSIHALLLLPSLSSPSLSPSPSLFLCCLLAVTLAVTPAVAAE
mmetsp:Transcript_1004/g.2081  ORF Transcript_1004/g.2081 Transcript_1004/m.2081 type:complete len:245 (+) Transcript_1004:910-1644(+)